MPAESWRGVPDGPRKKAGVSRSPADLRHSVAGAAKRINLLPAEVISADLSDDDVRRILESWTFPLHSVDLKVSQEDVDQLRQRQRDWDPDGAAFSHP